MICVRTRRSRNPPSIRRRRPTISAAARVAAASAALDLAKRNYDRSVVSAHPRPEPSPNAWSWRASGPRSVSASSTSPSATAIKVSARVPEAWAPELAGLEEFSFTVGVSGPVHTAKLYSVQPVVEEASRSFEIVGTAANDGSMKPGMFANVTLEAPTVKQSLWLPASAVATSDLPQVLMVEDGAIVYRKVRIGRRADGSDRDRRRPVAPERR